MCVCVDIVLWILGTLYIPEVPEVQCAHFLSTQFNNSVVTNSSQLIDCCKQLYIRYVKCMCVCPYICYVLSTKIFILLAKWCHV